MSKIKQLSPLEAQKIAAGEVVERPTNVVKELIENALDAGASSITLYLENAGKTLIRCIDNGSGMSPEDARACILHHATSKIQTVDDLDSLITFGFRGEALSSIASVSRLSLTTKEASTQSALCLEIVEGTIVKETIVAANTGTDIAISDLFFNVPARKKFLKTKETEWRALVSLFQACCLAYPEVSYKLYHEDRLVYNYPAVSSLVERLAQLFEQPFVKNILEHTRSHEKKEITCTAAFSTPTYVRFDRSQIFVFVNKRWVKNYKLTQALIKGYAGILPPGKYPAGCIFLTLDPCSVDVNIHPRKEEVHFTHPGIIEDLITSTVQEKFEELHTKQLGGVSPLSLREPDRSSRTSFDTSSFLDMLKAAPAPKGSTDPQKDEHAFLAAIAPHFTKETLSSSHPIESSSEEKRFQEPLATPIESNREEKLFQEPLLTPMTIPQVQPSQELQFRLIGHLARTYILLETDKGLVLVDQHAAHERILYEKFRSHFAHPSKVPLLIPHIITLTKEDATLLEPHLPLLSSFGIEAHLISDHQLSIQETSIYTKNVSLEDCIQQIISTLNEESFLDPKELSALIQERFHASMSCKAALKAGDILSVESMHKLITDLSTTENKSTCPHGRPTLWELSKSDIEKKFKRDYR